jgi:hypothetical protein
MSPYIRNMKASMKEQLKRVGPLETRYKKLKEQWQYAVDKRSRVDIESDGKFVRDELNDVRRYLHLCNRAIMEDNHSQYLKLQNYNYYKEYTKCETPS